jgi:hypothetical protein
LVLEGILVPLLVLVPLARFGPLKALERVVVLLAPFPIIPVRCLARVLAVLSGPTRSRKPTPAAVS